MYKGKHVAPKSTTTRRRLILPAVAGSICLIVATHTCSAGPQIAHQWLPLEPSLTEPANSVDSVLCASKEPEFPIVYLDPIDPMETEIRAEPLVMEVILPSYHGEYQEAYTVWQRLTEEGYNKYVVAGILGNMMAECGGQTLNLQTTIYGGNGGYYGICQWSKRYCGTVHGADLNVQIEYLLDTIQQEFKMFGKCLGCTYDEFCALEDEQQTAYYFAKIYERCGSGSYNVRKSNAIKALEHFEQEVY